MLDNVVLTPICASDRPIVDKLFSLYLYDMSRYTRWPIGDSGTFDFDPAILDPYWLDPDHHPFFIMVGTEIAGFSLLRKFPNDDSLNDIGQFFVLGKFKGQGIGAEAFRQSVQKFPGEWLTRVLPDNQGAKQFWVKVISDLTNSKYQVSRDLYQGKEMDFIRYRI